MNKKHYLLILISLITIGVFYYLNQSKSTLDDEFDIALEAGIEVDEIKLRCGSKELLLSKVDGQWEIDKQGIADGLKVGAFLEMLRSLNVRTPVTGSKGLDVKRQVSENGVQVMISSGKKRIYELYFIQNPAGMKGNFAFCKSHQYVVQLNMGDREAAAFSCEPSFWQSKKIFSVTSDRIEEIKVVWSDENTSFLLEKSEDIGYRLFQGEEDITQQTNAHKLKFYTYEFANLRMDDLGVEYKQFIGDLFCEISIKDSNRKYTKVLFYTLKKPNGLVDRNNVVLHLDNSEVWGKVSYLKINPVLKKIDFFLLK